MVLEGFITAYVRCRETGTEAWSWKGLSRPLDGVGRQGQKHGLGTVCHGLWALYGAEARFFERYVTAFGRCRETGTAASSWNGLSPSRDGVERLGRKNGLITVYHGLWTM